LGVSNHTHAVLGQRAERVDESVDEVPVTVAPPQQHMVHDLVGVLIDEVTDPVQQQVPEIVVNVVVVTDLHDDHARLDPEPVRQATYPVGLARGRAHFRMPPSPVRPGRSDGARVSA
jgi:hypothetical protein